MDGIEDEGPALGMLLGSFGLQRRVETTHTTRNGG
jgi:hypothetical protein